jgi:hypothetical protein
MDTIALAKTLAMHGQPSGAADDEGKAIAYEVKPHHIADALAERRLCAQAVLPYVSQKLPINVDMRSTKAIHLNILNSDQYEDLVKVAAEPGDGAQSISVQLMNGIVAETTEPQQTDAPLRIRDGTAAWPSTELGITEQGCETGVVPPVAPALPRSGDRSPPVAAAPPDPRVTWLPNEASDWWDQRK